MKIKKALYTIIFPVIFFLMAVFSVNAQIPNRRVIERSLIEIETVRLAEIERLLVLCRDRKISADYEMVDYTVVKNFIFFIRDDLNNRNTARAAYALRCLEEACSRVIISLNAYLSGGKIPMETARYVTGPVEIQGSSFIGKAVNSAPGAETARPLFFTGYGHFDKIINDIPEMTGYGVNILQTEIGPRDTVIEEGNGYGFNAAGVERLVNILREAEKHNVRVDVLLSPHYFPQWVFRKHPHLRENTGGFLTFNVYEQEAKKVIETHITGVMEIIKDYVSLNSVCISNEPVFPTARNFNVRNVNSAVNAMWRQFLAETHGTIENLNSVYRTRFRDFGAVPMPQGIEASPQFYDWMVFNNRAFGGWHQWMAELVHRTAPDVPVHSKIMDAVLSPEGGRASLLWGVDPEYFAQFSQLHGNDANNFLSNDGAGIISKMKWYDFLMSLKKMPLFNSEDHVIKDRAGDYIPQQAIHVRSDIWQGAIRGRTAAVIWVWERTHDANSDFAGSILHRPDVVSIVGRTNLDLNRLSNELTAFQNEPAACAILFSNSARIYDASYLNVLDKAYKSLIFNGQKAGFITEKQLAEGQTANYRIIIVPAAVHVTPETLGAIKNFLGMGGKVLVLGDKSLSRDVYGRPVAGADRNFIMENSTVIRNAEVLTEQELINITEKILAENGLTRITVRDNKTRRLVNGVEWQSAEYEKRLLVNICSYDWSGNKSIGIFAGNRPVGNVKELISGNTINADNIELPPFSPILLEINLN